MHAGAGVVAIVATACVRAGTGVTGQDGDSAVYDIRLLSSRRKPALDETDE